MNKDHPTLDTQKSVEIGLSKLFMSEIASSSDGTTMTDPRKKVIQVLKPHCFGIDFPILNISSTSTKAIILKRWITFFYSFFWVFIIFFSFEKLIQIRTIKFTRKHKWKSLMGYRTQKMYHQLDHSQILWAFF